MVQCWQLAEAEQRGINLTTAAAEIVFDEAHRWHKGIRQSLTWSSLFTQLVIGHFRFRSSVKSTRAYHISSTLFSVALTTALFSVAIHNELVPKIELLHCTYLLHYSPQLTSTHHCILKAARTVCTGKVH